MFHTKTLVDSHLNSIYNKLLNLKLYIQFTFQTRKSRTAVIFSHFLTFSYLKDIRMRVEKSQTMVTFIFSETEDKIY